MCCPKGCRLCHMVIPENLQSSPFRGGLGEGAWLDHAPLQGGSPEVSLGKPRAPGWVVLGPDSWVGWNMRSSCHLIPQEPVSRPDPAPAYP